MSFFRKLSSFFSKTTRQIYANFFQGLGENTWLLQLALKNTVLDLKPAF